MPKTKDKKKDKKEKAKDKESDEKPSKREVVNSSRGEDSCRSARSDKSRKKSDASKRSARETPTIDESQRSNKSTSKKKANVKKSRSEVSAKRNRKKYAGERVEVERLEKEGQIRPVGTESPLFIIPLSKAKSLPASAAIQSEREKLVKWAKSQPFPIVLPEPLGQPMNRVQRTLQKRRLKLGAEPAQAVEIGFPRVEDKDEESGTISEPESEVPSPSREVSLREGAVDDVYEIKEELGKGKYGIVRRVTNKKTNKDYAAKFVDAHSSDVRAMFDQEILILNKLQHKRIIQLIDALVPSRHRRVMVMEIIEGGELFELVTARRFDLTEYHCVKIMRQVCTAVSYMHSRQIIHMDLKPENIMCVTRRANRIKLIDFGLSIDASEKLPKCKMCGTYEFVAPEVVNFEQIGYKTDMWSVGVITYILLSGYSPFLGDSDTQTQCNVTKATYDFDLEEFDDISDTAKDFIGKLLVKDLDERMSPAECLKHDWLQKTEDEQSKKLHHKKRLRRYFIRRRWRKAIHAILAVRRMGWDLRYFWESEAVVDET